VKFAAVWLNFVLPLLIYRSSKELFFLLSHSLKCGV